MIDFSRIRVNFADHRVIPLRIRIMLEIKKRRRFNCVF